MLLRKGDIGVFMCIVTFENYFENEKGYGGFWMNEGWFMCIDTLKNYFKYEKCIIGIFG